MVRAVIIAAENPVPGRYSQSTGFCSACYILFRNLISADPELNQFKEYNFCVVSLPRAQLQNSGVTTVSVCVLRCDFIEQLANYVFIEHISQHLSSCVKIAALC